MADSLRGLIVPCITPFHDDGSVAEELLPPYLEYLAPWADAVVVCAVYGSGLLMRLEERERVAEVAAEVLAGKSDLVVFAGAADTGSAVVLARHAASVGAAAVTCVAPFYYKQSEEALYRHFEALVSAVELPIYAYDSPAYAGNELSLPLLERLAAAGLAGVITGQAGYGIDHLWKVLRTLGADLSVLSIRDGLALPALMAGAAGFESGVANYFPELASSLLQAARDGDYAQAAVLQERILRLRDVSHGLGKNIPSLHALTRMRGLETGVPRRPFLPLSEDEVAWLKRGIAGIGFETPLHAGG